MLLSDEVYPLSSMNALSHCLPLIIPIPSEVQKRQDLLIGLDSDPLTPDELSSYTGTLSLIKSGDSPSSSPKHTKLESKTALEENKLMRKKKIEKELDRKSVFDFIESNGEEQKF